MRWFTVFAVAGALALGAAGGFLAGTGYERDQAAKKAAVADAEAARIAAVAAEPENEARRVLRQTLKDPDSLMLRSVIRRGDVLCGEVNGKNSMGGYVGFTPFFIDKGNVEVLPPDYEDWPFSVVDELKVKCPDTELPPVFNTRP